MHRWIGTSVVASLFMLRIVLAQGVSTFFLLAPVVALEDRILILLHLRACLASPAVSAHLVVHRYVPRLLQCQRLMTANGTFVYFPVFEQCAVSPIILTSTMTFILISSRFRRTWIYLLNLLLAFLQPKFDPSLEEDLTADEIEEGGTSSESGFLPLKMMTSSGHSCADYRNGIFGTFN